MGVKGLTSYVNDKHGFHQVSLSDLVARSKDRSQKFIVDGSSLLFFLISGTRLFQSIDNAHGGQYLQCVVTLIRDHDEGKKFPTPWFCATLWGLFGSVYSGANGLRGFFVVSGSPSTRRHLFNISKTETLN
jgi:hypothetical protein